MDHPENLEEHRVSASHENRHDRGIEPPGEREHVVCPGRFDDGTFPPRPTGHFAGRKNEELTAIAKMVRGFAKSPAILAGRLGPAKNIDRDQ